MDDGLDKAEFDRFADEYHALHVKNLACSGEQPEFFAEYKIADVARSMAAFDAEVNGILDFGAGVGSSVPWFRKYFPNAALTCADVSEKSIALAKERFGDKENYVVISGTKLPLAPDSVDLAFTACVFHHIPHEEHIHWLEEILRVTKPGGRLVIFEHNPWNPLTVHVVNTCEFDVNAKLISTPTMRARLRATGWQIERVAFRIFFPRALAILRPLEKYLTKLPLGGQYYIIGRKVAR